MKPDITSTYFSDGKRKLTVLWDSPSGERKILFDLEDIINKYFEEL